jgi:CheY-like chemotaxis protein
MTCIVVVDDQGTSRRVISKLASTIEDNAAVVEFEDPFDALSFFEDNTPDLVITDYSMPIINGAEFIRRVRGMPKCHDVPVVVVTTYTNPEFRRLALEAGTTEYLSLPLNFDEFRLKSRNLLALRNSRRLANAQFDSPTAEEVYARELEQSRACAELLDGLVQTLSRRLVEKIEQLDLADGDLTAFLEVSPSAAIFVDEDLRIRRFTAAAASLFDLGTKDIGRHLPLTNSYLSHCNLADDLNATKEHRKTIQKFVILSKTGHVYQIRMIPIKYNNDALWGAIISFDRMQIGAEGMV